MESQAHSGLLYKKSQSEPMVFATECILSGYWKKTEHIFELKAVGVELNGRS